MVNQQKGYAAILLIAFILIGIFIFAFVVEVGELLIVNAKAEQAAEAGAHAAGVALAAEAVRLRGDGVMDADLIKDLARTLVEEKTRDVVQENGAQFVPPIEYVPDDGVKVTIKKTFTPFFDKLINRTFEFKKSAQSKANIKTVT